MLNCPTCNTRLELTFSTNYPKGTTSTVGYGYCAGCSRYRRLTPHELRRVLNRVLAARA